MSLLKRQTQWFLVFIAPLLWYLYWILYDIIVWNKALIEVNLLNYIGMSVSLFIIFIGSKIRKVEMPKTCLHYFGYLSEHSTENEMPEECITCEKAIECICKRYDST